MRIRRGDQVVVIAGKEKNRQGTVKQVHVADKRVVVEGLNMGTKHVKGNPRLGTESRIEKLEKSIHISNVMLWNPHTKRPDRVSYQFNADGEKMRVFRSNKIPVESHGADHE